MTMADLERCVISQRTVHACALNTLYIYAAGSTCIYGLCRILHAPSIGQERPSGSALASILLIDLRNCMRSQLSHGTHHVQHAHCAARETPAPVHLVPISRGALLGTCAPQWPGSPTRPRWGGGEKRRVQRMPRPACAMLGSVH